MTFEQHAADAALLLRHLGVPRAHVAGHSTGEAIDLQLAVTNRISFTRWFFSSLACRQRLAREPALAAGGVLQAIKDADTFFGSYLVALSQWNFGPKEAAMIAQPALSVVGTETDQWFVEGHELLHTWFPRIEGCKIDGVGHLLHMQRPERLLSNVGAWLARHPI